MVHKLVKKRRLSANVQKGVPVTRELVRKQLSNASFSDYMEERDPMFHASEEYASAMDSLGTHAVEKQLLAMKENTPGLTGPSGKRLAEETPEQAGGVFAPLSRLEEQSNMEDDFEERGGAHRLKKFSELSFKRGKMSAAVVQGTGSMMLFSCLRRTLGQSQPKRIQQRKLFEEGSRSWKPQAGKAADADRTKLIRNEVFPDSAIALTFDVTKDARRTVDQMSALIEAGGTGTETWERQMPFLSVQKEQTMLEQYQQRKKELDEKDPGNRDELRILNEAITSTKSMMAKKARMRINYIFRLRALSNSAKEAALLFSDDEYRQTLKNLLLRQQTYQEPPEGDPPPEDELPPGDGGQEESPMGDTPPEEET